MNIKKTLVYKTLHRIVKIEQYKTTKKGGGGELWGSGRVGSSCSNSDTHYVTVKQYEQHLIWKPGF